MSKGSLDVSHLVLYLIRCGLDLTTTNYFINEKKKMTCTKPIFKTIARTEFSVGGQGIGNSKESGVGGVGGERKRASGRNSSIAVLEGREQGEIGEDYATMLHISQNKRG